MRTRKKDKDKFLAMTAKERRDELSRLKLLFFDLIETIKLGGDVSGLVLTKRITKAHIDYLKPIVKEENIEAIRMREIAHHHRKREISEFFTECAREVLQDDDFDKIMTMALNLQEAEDELLIKANNISLDD